MPMYTRRGDQGQTDLQQGVRAAKDALPLEVFGTLDELGAILGLVRAEAVPGEIDHVLERLQNELFDLGAQLSRPDPDRPGPAVGPAHVARLEADIDRLGVELSLLSGFILPGGTRAAALLHLARAVCRRGERRLVSLVQQPEGRVAPEALAYLNRLGDLLFVLARLANQRAGRSDVAWP